MTPEAKELFEAWVKEFSAPRAHISEKTIFNLGYPAFERGWEEGFKAGFSAALTTNDGLEVIS